MGFGDAQIKREGSRIPYDMTTRNQLHISKLGDFTLWLMAHGWQYQVTRGNYEVLRMSKREVQGPLIVFRSERGLEHYTVYGTSEKWFTKWQRSLRGERKKGNTDRSPAVVETPAVG